MEDSPLSITASVTGILTFVAAIIAFIYVRYNTLRNGRAEMVSVLESVTATIAETREVATATPAPAAESESDSAAGQLAKLVGDLYRIELAILAQYMKVYGTNVASMQSNLRPDDGTSSAATWQDALQVVATSYARKPATIPSYFSRVTQALQASIPNGEAAAQVTTGVMGVLTMSMQFVAYSGAYPTMIRWYMVRDEVLEKVKEREAVRSRLMFHQVFAANV